MSNIDRREFLRRMGLGTAVVVGASLAGCRGRKSPTGATGETSADEMEYRTNPNTGDRVSLLGYGCMRWPSKGGGSARESGSDEIDQDEVNRLVDYAIEHGVNYFDTSPAYCKGKSEEATGIALSRHPRDSYFIATKLSNFAPETWSHEAGVQMYHDSMRYLQTDYIDYMLLHSVGNGARDLEGNDLNGMEAFNARYIDNGILDFLVAERAAGRIRNLGFSYHGDIEVFDYLLSQHDKYHWDFVQIQLNYVDWLHAKEINERNTNGEYLYAELVKRGIPAVIMEPLLGGRLAKLPYYAQKSLRQAAPEASIASWAFRYAGTPEGVLTVLSGMTFMEHLQDNLRTYSPFTPCDEAETAMLHRIADAYVKDAYIPCTACQYCMPCPYGIDIPSIFAHYNLMVNEGTYDVSTQDPGYRRARQAFLVGYDRSVPRLRQASHCIGCNQCVSHCPQRIDIPGELHRIDRYVERLKQGRDSAAEAKRLLEAGGCTLVVVSADGTATTYNQRGVSDLLHLLDHEPRRLAGASVADKIIGKAAAALMIQGRAREVYTPVITADARRLFADSGIHVDYGTEVGMVENRTRTGRCPLDSTCADFTRPQDMATAIRQFVESNK